jgi:hypothetical protein
MGRWALGRPAFCADYQRSEKIKMKRFFLVSLLTFLAVFAFGGGLLTVSWGHHSDPEISPIQIVE